MWRAPCTSTARRRCKMASRYRDLCAGTAWRRPRPLLTQGSRHPAPANPKRGLRLAGKTLPELQAPSRSGVAKLMHLSPGCDRTQATRQPFAALFPYCFLSAQARNPLRFGTCALCSARPLWAPVTQVPAHIHTTQVWSTLQRTTPRLSLASTGRLGTSLPLGDSARPCCWFLRLHCLAQLRSGIVCSPAACILTWVRMISTHTGSNPSTGLTGRRWGSSVTSLGVRRV